MLSILALLMAGIVWIVWQQRARKNAAELGSRGQRHTEPLAALSWIIPFANVFLPKQVTDDLWRASDPDAPPVGNIAGRPVPALVTAWWALWIIGAVLGQVILRTDPPEDISQLDGFISSVRLQIGADVLVVVSAVLAITIARRITDRLIQRAARAGIPAG